MANETERGLRRDVLTTSLALVVSSWLAACVPSVGPESMGQHEEPIVAGASDPEMLGRSVPELQQNAVVEELLFVGGTGVTTCTGTLIGDRVVLTAGHCVMQNMRDWWMDGVPVIVAEPEDFSVRIGADAEDPLCEIDVAEVHLHPDISRRFEDAMIDRDLALLILRSSTQERCPGVVLPIPFARPEDVPPELDESLLIGGYGTTDPQAPPAVSWERFWAVAQLSQRSPATLLIEDTGDGFPAPGDSGAPVLRPASDGSLRVVGVMSTAYSGRADATRPDSELAFLDSVLDRDLVCGAIPDVGTCVGDLAVRCEQDRLDVVDCAVGSSECTPGEPASCACACDVDAHCNDGCDCDVDCPCTCDETTDCDGECSCDPDCTEPSCACDDTAACDPDCECDPSCAEPACEGACAGNPTCTCDASSECDEDCDCDSDCRPRASGCHFAPFPPAGRLGWGWGLGLLALVLGRSFPIRNAG